MKEKSPLSKRQTQILELAKEGLTYKEMARELGVSRHTIKNHIGHLFQKLDAKCMTHAVIIALRKGYIKL